MFHNSTTCKKCSSDQTQSFQMVYETGTSSGAVRFLTTDGDSIGFGGGQTSSQTVLAQKVAPPDNPDFTAVHLIAAFLVPFGALIFGLVFLPVWLAFIIAAVFGVAVYYGFTAEIKKKMPIYEIQMTRWRRSWICLKCGAMWELKK